MSSRSRARVGGWICAVSLQKGGMGVEMRVLVRISPILLFPDTFRVKLYPPKQIRGGLEFCPKGLSAWACLLGKNGAFPETLETSFLAIT